LRAQAAKKPPPCVVACVVTQNLLRRRAIVGVFWGDHKEILEESRFQE